MRLSVENYETQAPRWEYSEYVGDCLIFVMLAISRYTGRTASHPERHIVSFYNIEDNSSVLY